MATERSKFFFSYSREDSAFVLRLARELRDRGANLWLDQLDMGGQRWDEAVQLALASCQGMLAVLSPSSVASQNVMDEVSYALEEGKQVVPVLYRECTIPFRLEHSLESLVRSLRAALACHPRYSSLWSWPFLGRLPDFGLAPYRALGGGPRIDCRGDLPEAQGP